MAPSSRGEGCELPGGSAMRRFCRHGCEAFDGFTADGSVVTWERVLKALREAQSPRCCKKFQASAIPLVFCVSSAPHVPLKFVSSRVDVRLQSCAVCLENSVSFATIFLQPGSVPLCLQFRGVYVQFLLCVHHVDACPDGGSSW